MFSIAQWYAYPASIDGKMIQQIIDIHHIFIIDRSRCWSQGILGMGDKPYTWRDVATEKNGTGLSLEIAMEQQDKQSNKFTQTSFSDNVENEIQANGDTNEAESFSNTKMDCSGI